MGNCVVEDEYTLNVVLPGATLDNGDVVDVDTWITVKVLSDAMTHHNFTEFSAETIADGSWKLVIDPVSKCACEADKIYYPVCQNDCGVDFNAPEFTDVHEVVAAPGHVFDLENGWHEAEKKPGESPCGQQDVWVNECVNCYLNNDLVHMDCVLTEVRKEAPGHTWGEWTPVVGEDRTYVRFCTVCPAYDVNVIPSEIVVLPELNTEDYTYVVTLAPTCVDTGKATYTHNDTGIVIEVELDALGHAYSETSKYSVEVINNVPILSLECDACDHVEVINLPELYTAEGFLNRGYLVNHGHCLQKNDKYTFALAMDDELTIVVEFELDGGYEHDAAPELNGAVDLDKCVLVEGTEKNYYVYKCDKCGQWIVAYVENK